STEGSNVQRSELQSALDRQTALENAGQTSHGLLWRVVGSEVPGGTPEQATNENWFVEVARPGSHAFFAALWWVQVVVLVGMILLALPTGEVVERPERRRKKVVPIVVADPALASEEAAASETAAPEEADALEEAAAPEETAATVVQDQQDQPEQEGER